MSKPFNQNLLTLGLAIFSMFFGAGNVIFPLALGAQTQSKCFYAFAGLFLTAIGGPLLGLLGATLYQGKCSAFFSRFGKGPQIFFMFSTLALLGPFAVLPRCVTVSYASLSHFFPFLPLSLFALLFCLACLFCCMKKNWILPLLGNILSPLLLLCLMSIIFKAFFTPSSLIDSSFSAMGAFTKGLSTGYDTMDLIASIYFSAGIWSIVASKAKNVRQAFKITLKGGLIGCLLLGFVYIGLTYAAAKYAQPLASATPEKLITLLARLTLGPFWGNLANIAVALACFTTIISLCMALSKILVEEIFTSFISQKQMLFILLGITTLTSNLGFQALMKVIHPAVSIGYPFIIALTLINIYVCLSKKSKKTPLIFEEQGN